MAQMYFYNTWCSILVVYLLLLCKSYVYFPCTRSINDLICESSFAFHNTIFGTFQFFATQALAVLLHSIFSHIRMDNLLPNPCVTCNFVGHLSQLTRRDCGSVSDPTGWRQIVDVVSSTYLTAGRIRSISFIMVKKSRGPNFATCGTPPYIMWSDID